MFKYKKIKIWHRHNPNTYRDLTVFFWGAAQVKDVPHVIYKVVFGGVLLSPCCIVRIQETTQQPHIPNQGSLGHGRLPQRWGVSCEGNYLFIIPWYGAVLGWGVYISEHLWNTPSCKTPPGYERSMMNGGPFFILVRGGLLVDLCHPATHQMVKIQRLGV